MKYFHTLASFSMKVLVVLAQDLIYGFVYMQLMLNFIWKNRFQWFSSEFAPNVGSNYVFYIKITCLKTKYQNAWWGIYYDNSVV
jgi:hypothetical protein